MPLVECWAHQFLQTNEGTGRRAGPLHGNLSHNPVRASCPAVWRIEHPTMITCFVERAVAFGSLQATAMGYTGLSTHLTVCITAMLTGRCQLMLMGFWAPGSL